jgi:hypothetical protein
MIYHGGLFEGNSIVGRMDENLKDRIEIELPEGWKRYGHFQLHPKRDDLLVSDGYFQTETDEPGKGRWLSLQHVDWKKGKLSWTPICEHHSSWNDQDDHPHPIFDHLGKYIYYTGGTPEGRRAVYRVKVSE